MSLFYKPTNDLDSWPEGERPISFDEDGKTTIWWWCIFPLLFVFQMFHFTLCTMLTIFIHPESRRIKIYEYYAPWGWGKRKDGS